MKTLWALVAGLTIAGSAWAADDLPLGTKIPDFKLADVSSGTEFSPADFTGKKALVVVFLCRHCPYVQHVKKSLAALASEYESKEIAFVGISSNDPKAYPDDAPASLAEMAKEEGFTFPLLFDETQAVARAYTAKATPDVFIFDGEQKLVYRGQFDDTRPGKGKASDGADVRKALDAILAGRPVPADQKPAVGCSIKWKK